MRIAVTILEPISGPFGTYYTDGNGVFLRWKYCVKINDKWYFRTVQKVKENE